MIPASRAIHHFARYLFDDSNTLWLFTFILYFDMMKCDKR